MTKAKRRLCNSCGGAFLPKGMAKHKSGCTGKAPAEGVPHWKTQHHCPKCGEMYVGNPFANHARVCSGTPPSRRKPSKQRYGSRRETAVIVDGPLTNGNQLEARLTRVEKAVTGIMTAQLKSLQVLVDELNKHRDAF